MNGRQGMGVLLLLAASLACADEAVGIAPLLADAADSAVYAAATRALHDGHWAEAIAQFDAIARGRGAHADGAQYWKAVAEEHAGQKDQAMNSCAELRKNWPSSHWIEECAALEIEVRGHAAAASSSEDVRVLAINQRMLSDEPGALKEIEQLLRSSGSDQLKSRLLYVLAQSKSPAARALLVQVGRGKFARTPTSPVTAQALHLLGGTSPEGKPYGDLPAGQMTLDVMVRDKAGKPVDGLTAADISVFDNGVEQKIETFTPGSTQPTEAILLIDAVNVGTYGMAHVRQQLEDYLARQKQLPLPTTLVYFTEQGTEIQQQPTRDANILLELARNLESRVRALSRAGGLYAAAEERSMAIRMLTDLAQVESRRPGRKLLVWISGNWQSFAGSDYLMTQRESKAIFARVVSLNRQLGLARMTIETVDPHSVGSGSQFPEFYKQFVDPPADARLVQYDALMLETVAAQTGGQVLYGSNDLGILIGQALMDGTNYCTLSYHPPTAKAAHELHRIEVRIKRQGMVARTRRFYYAEP